MSTGYKVIYPKNIRGTIVTSQHDMHFYGANKAVYQVFDAEYHLVANSWTGKSDTTNETKYAYIQEMLDGITLKCKRLKKACGSTAWQIDQIIQF